jgi:hypothetical protein
MELLTDDTQRYVGPECLTNPSPTPKLKDKAAEHVTIEGEKVAQGGVDGIVGNGAKEPAERDRGQPSCHSI